MSDMLQPVVNAPTLNSKRELIDAGESPVLTGLRVGNVDDKLKRIGHSLSTWNLEYFL
ncbi:MAG TPA: hypothetical protein VL866_09460 [Pyrinomonadaceae bacterium]|nr:hypothetical protein [Pyrinomonadaceae bacterium]